MISCERARLRRQGNTTRELIRELRGGMCSRRRGVRLRAPRPDHAEGAPQELDAPGVAGGAGPGPVEEAAGAPAARPVAQQLVALEILSRPQLEPRMVGGPARKGSGRGSAAEAAGPPPPSVLAMLGAVMPREPD